jgi:voltage-gated potassium channel Kch
MPPDRDLLMIIVGGDALALSTARELSLLQGRRIVVLWPADLEFARAVEAVGAQFIAGRPDSRAGLEMAGVADAVTILALSHNDQLNLQAALRARDANPHIRIVLRQFNRTLAAKIEQNLSDCSVLSLAWHSAATYAAAALDPSWFRGLQFPEPKGPLSGFATRTTADRLSGQRVADAERALGARIVAIDGATEIGRDDVVPRGSELVVYGRLDRLLASTPRQPIPPDRPSIEQRLRRRLRRSDGPTHRLDPYLIGFVITVLMLFAAGTWYFHGSFGTDWLTAAYFVMSTMTTTGFGDIFPDHSRALDLWATMVLMLLGTVFTGLFIVFAAARLTRAQWVRMQGLRPIHRRGHIVVCGSGSIGTGAIDLLLAFDKPLVVVEANPDAALVERARERGFDLLTGDASRDDTLDLCNLGAAHSLIALTNVDTLNLEIALGARARNPSMPVVLRIAEATFAQSIAASFRFTDDIFGRGVGRSGLCRAGACAGRARPDRVRRRRICDHRERAGRRDRGAVAARFHGAGSRRRGWRVPADPGYRRPRPRHARSHSCAFGPVPARCRCGACSASGLVQHALRGGACERFVILRREPGAVPRRAIERRFQRAFEIAPHMVMECGFRVEAALAAQALEPARASRHMADLVFIDAAENGGAPRIAGAFEATDHLGRYIKAACFEHERHDRKARQKIIRRRRRGFPQPVMRRQLAISRAERRQPIGKQGEVFGFLCRDMDPVIAKRARCVIAREPRDDVPGKIDRVQLDMRQRVQ